MPFEMDTLMVFFLGVLDLCFIHSSMRMLTDGQTDRRTYKRYQRYYLNASRTKVNAVLQPWSCFEFECVFPVLCQHYTLQCTLTHSLHLCSVLHSPCAASRHWIQCVFSFIPSFDIFIKDSFYNFWARLYNLHCGLVCFAFCMWKNYHCFDSVGSLPMSSCIIL